MKGKVLKIVYWAVGIIAVILAFLWFLGTYGYQIQNYLLVKQQEKALAEGEKLKAEILEAQKNDTYGGQTPEETLDLYIAALKAGDIELASKYYEVSVENISLQSDELGILKKILNRDGNLGVVIGNIEDIMNSKDRGYLSDDEYVVTYIYTTSEDATSTTMYAGTEYSWSVPKGSQKEISVALRLNPYTKVWKIIQ